MSFVENSQHSLLHGNWSEDTRATSLGCKEAKKQKEYGSKSKSDTSFPWIKVSLQSLSLQGFFFFHHSSLWMLFFVPCTPYIFQQELDWMWQNIGPFSTLDQQSLKIGVRVLICWPLSASNLVLVSPLVNLFGQWELLCIHKGILVYTPLYFRQQYTLPLLFSMFLYIN